MSIPSLPEKSLQIRDMLENMLEESIKIRKDIRKRNPLRMLGDYTHTIRIPILQELLSAIDSL